MEEIDFLYVLLRKKNKLEVKIKNSEDITKYLPKPFIDTICQNCGSIVVTSLKNLKNHNTIINDLEETTIFTIILTNDIDDETYIQVKNNTNTKALLPEIIIDDISNNIGLYIKNMLKQLKPKTEN